MKAILTYHSIDDSQSVISLDRGTFRGHLEWLRAARVPVRPLAELADPGCTDGVALTFDDGFENFATEAWPLLREYGLPATVFVVSDRVAQDNDWDAGDSRIPRLRLMDWPTLAALARDGLDLGGHSRTHPDLRRLAGDALAEEVGGGRSEIAERTNTFPTAFAYPYGSYDSGTVEAVERAGYTLAVTTEMRLLDRRAPARLELPRLDGFYLRRLRVLEAWGTPSFRRFVWLRARARGVRRALARAGFAA